MKTEINHTARNRYLILGIMALLAGSYWNLSWLLALPIITLLCPFLIAVASHYLFAKEAFTKKAGIFALTIVTSAIIRNLLYITFGQGLDYLLHDGETQLVVLALLIEQLVIGSAILGTLTLLGRRH